MLIYARVFLPMFFKYFIKFWSYIVSLIHFCALFLCMDVRKCFHFILYIVAPFSRLFNEEVILAPLLPLNIRFHIFLIGNR